MRHNSDRWSDMLRGAAVAVVLLGTVGSVLASRAWETTVDRQRDERLDRTKTARTASIEVALGDYEEALRAARSLWLASGTVDEEEFKVFVRSLDRETRYPGLQNISWREVVRGDEAASYEAAARSEDEASRGRSDRSPTSWSCPSMTPTLRSTMSRNAGSGSAAGPRVSSGPATSSRRR